MPSQREGFRIDASRAALATAVLVALVAFNAWSRWRGLDIKDYDDLSRTTLSKFWADYPAFFRSPAFDVYWLPLPFLTRGTAIWLGELAGWRGAMPALTIIHAATILWMWGVWACLDAVVRGMGGKLFARVALAFFYLASMGTFDFSASNYSETDFLLCALIATLAVVGMERRGATTPGAVAALGIALCAGAMARYEGWTVALAFGPLAVWRWRNAPGSRLRWLWLAPAPAAIAIWIGLGWSRSGDAGGFVKQGAGFIGAFAGENIPLRVADGFVSHNYALAPALLALGVWELARRRDDPATRWLALLTAILGAWSVFKLCELRGDRRFTWDVMTLLAAPAALCAERIAKEWDRVTRACAAGLAAIVGLASFLGQAAAERPFLRPELRAFAREVDRLTPQGRVLLRDCLDFDHKTELLTFRTLIDLPKAVSCDWVDGCERLAPENVESLDFRVVIARKRPEDVAVEEAPFAQTGDGWGAWRLRREARR